MMGKATRGRKKYTMTETRPLYCTGWKILRQEQQGIRNMEKVCEEPDGNSNRLKKKRARIYNETRALTKRRPPPSKSCPDREFVSKVRIRTADPGDFLNLMGTFCPKMHQNVPSRNAEESFKNVWIRTRIHPKLNEFFLIHGYKISMKFRSIVYTSSCQQTHRQTEVSK